MHTPSEPGDTATPLAESADHAAASRILHDQRAQDWTRNRWWSICPDLLGLINAKGHLVATNPAWEGVLGWTAEEIRIMQFIEFVHPDDVPATERAWQDIVLHGQSAIHFENRYLCQDGHYKALSWIAVPDGDFVYCLARDVAAEVQRWAARARMMDTDAALPTTG